MNQATFFSERIIVFIFIFIWGSLIVSAGSAHGKTYDIYVDAAYDGEEKGTNEEPYQTIGKAVEKALENSSGDRSIYIASGTYNEKISLGKSVKLVGASQKKVAIMGKLTMSDGTSIANVTISGKGSGIIVESDASVSIENCRVREFGNIGIFGMKGKGKITLRDSEIKDGNGKGLYIEPGREILITGSSIVENDQEGLDIRYGVRGVIKDNVIVNNGESGIELIVGESDLEISENRISGNGASGIANQIYPDTKRKGTVNITQNTLSNNEKYGVDCNTPQKGVTGSSLHWTRSISLEENNFDSNILGSISITCGKLKVISSTDAAVVNALQEETAVDQPVITPLAEPEENIFDEVEALVAEYETASIVFENSLSEIEKRRGFKWWFYGLKYQERGKLLREQQSLRAIQVEVGQMETSIIREENRIFLAETKNRLMEREKSLNERFEAVEQRFSLGGWVRSLLRR